MSVQENEVLVKITSAGTISIPKQFRKYIDIQKGEYQNMAGNPKNSSWQSRSRAVLAPCTGATIRAPGAHPAQSDAQKTLGILNASRNGEARFSPQ